MPTIPAKISTHLSRLAATLKSERRAVFDFETSGVRLHESTLVGCGFYFPECHSGFYINIGHAVHDPAFPLFPPVEFANCIVPFTSDPARHLIAHNAYFDLRCLSKIGVEPRCRVSCSLVHTHRTDENLASYNAGSPTYHELVDEVTYSLKPLTAVFAREKPPELLTATGGLNALHADIAPVAKYCVQDCVNTWFLFERAERMLVADPQLAQLAVEIDDPANLVVAKMMQHGIGIDIALANSMRPVYERSIQECRLLIWRTLGINSALDTKRELLAVLRAMDLRADIGYDPFMQPFWTTDDPSVTGDILRDIYVALDPSDNKRLVIAAILSKWLMEQRVSAFIAPFVSRATNSRLYADRFSSTTVSTRFSSSPNLQNLPGRADDEGDESPTAILPSECRERLSTRNLLVAADGHLLLSCDLSAAEPMYLATACQRSLTVRDEEYRAAKRALQRERREKYPELLEAMYRNRDGYHEEERIQWPELENDPLWSWFGSGHDPYDGLLRAMCASEHQAAVAAGDERGWLGSNRWRGKKAFLALGYGSTPQSLAPSLGWSLERTQQAIKSLDEHYPVIPTLKLLTQKQLVHLGEIRTLWGRPRRINGYYSLSRPRPLTIRFSRRRTATGRSFVQDYTADVIPLGTYRQGTQVFIETCTAEGSNEVVLRGNPDGTVADMWPDDAFVYANIHKTFNTPPFCNIPFSQIRWVQERDTGLIRWLPRQARAERQAFNAIFQGTGADHLRWICNNIDSEVCRRDEFRDCRLILTMHDSLLFEVPSAKWRAFAAAVHPLLTRPPPWATLDVRAKFELGIRFGRMHQVEPRDFL